MIKYLKCSIINGLVLIFENQREQYTYHQCICGKDIPAVCPPLNDNLPGCIGWQVIDEMVDDSLSSQCSDGGTQSIGHNHEKALGAGADGFVGFLVHKQRSGDIEEVESHTIHNHGEDEHPNPTAGIACTEKAKPQYPRKHGYQHDPLNAESTEEEGNQQDAERFRTLRE